MMTATSASTTTMRAAASATVRMMLISYALLFDCNSGGKTRASRMQSSSLEFLRPFGSKRPPSGCRAAEAPPSFAVFDRKGTARLGYGCATLSKLCANSTINAFGVVPQRKKMKPAVAQRVSFIRWNGDYATLAFLSSFNRKEYT